MKIKTVFKAIIFMMFMTRHVVSRNLRSLAQDGPSKIPVFYIDIGGQEIIDQPKVFGTYNVSDGSDTYSGRLGIEFIGVSSQEFPKKSYEFETVDSNDTDINVSILGFPKENDWILSGPYSDKTLLRHVLAYNISREMGHYASRTKYVDLMINDEYQGIYVLMEKIKRDSNRIDVSKNKDGETGYILKIDRPSKNSYGDRVFTENNSFLSRFGSDIVPDDYTVNVHMLYEYPKEKDISEDQKKYISTFIDDFEVALASPDFKNPFSGRSYDYYIDIESFIDFMIIQEISKNIDGYRLSTYLYKDVGGKLNMGAVWDFNIAFGNHFECEADLTTGWEYYFHSVCSTSYAPPFWFARLVRDPEFVSKFQERWSFVRKSFLSTENVLQTIDNYVDEISLSVDKNFTKWRVLGIYVWPNKFIGKTHREEVDFMKSWIMDRLEWMDSAIEAGEMATIDDGNAIGVIPEEFGGEETTTGTTTESSSGDSIFRYYNLNMMCIGIISVIGYMF